MANTNFIHWLDTFVAEKGLDTEHVFEVEGPEWGMNYIPLGVVLEAIKGAPAHEQAAIKNTIVRIDFGNDDVLDYFKHLAGALAM
jgi:hypothetical protein